MMDYRKRVFDCETKHDIGFTDEEINSLLEEVGGIDRDEFSEKVGVCTCMVIDEETVLYRRDVYVALMCCLESRDVKPSEFD